jgi:glycine/D-amino acid oxidase-like deaminating enzyme
MPKSSITRRRDLRTGTPLWLDGSSPLIRCSRAPGKQRFDTVIVGAGISGAALAYRLRRKGKKLLIVDRRPPLHGSTAASTALLEFEIDTPLFKLSKRIGRDQAERAWRRSVTAVRQLRRIVLREKISCGWRDAKSLYLAGDAFGYRALRKEVDARERAGIPGDYLNGAELGERFGIDRTGAILSNGSAQANPMQLAAGLLRLAVKAGASICSPVTIKAIAADKTGVILTTDDDVEIATRHAVFCTGYEILKSIPNNGHSTKSTWAFGSAPTNSAPDWLAGHIVWEAADPYLYLRLTHDDCVVAGGEDEPFSDTHADKTLLLEKTNIVAEKVRALIPGLHFRIAHRWAGAFGESDTGLPFIDRVPAHPNCYAVMGFGGNGITYSIIAAEVVSRLIAGRDDPDADLYRFPF